VLYLLIERIIGEDVDDAHEVDVLLVSRKDASLVLLVEPLMILQVSTALELISI